MKKFKVTEIIGSFGIFIDDEIEAEDEIDAKEEILNEIMDNIGNYIDIEVEEMPNLIDDED